MKIHRFSAVKRILVRFCFFHPQSTAVIHPLRKHQFSPSAVNRSHENSRSRPSFRSTAVNRSHAPPTTEIPQSTAVTAVNPQSTQSMQNLGLAGQDGDCHTATSGSKVANPRSHSVAAPSLKDPRRSRPWMLKPSAWHASYNTRACLPLVQPLMYMETSKVDTSISHGKTPERKTCNEAKACM